MVNLKIGDFLRCLDLDPFENKLFNNYWIQGQAGDILNDNNHKT